MRYTMREVLSATFGLAMLIVILEHAGGFSKVVSSSATGYATIFETITGHGAVKSLGYVSNARRQG